MSLAQLRLVRSAAERLRARAGMVGCEVMGAGLAGLAKGSGPLEQLHRRLAQGAMGHEREQVKERLT